MQESELPGLIGQVLWASFALAVAFGAIAQRIAARQSGAPSVSPAASRTRSPRSWLRLASFAGGVELVAFGGVLLAEAHLTPRHRQQARRAPIKIPRGLGRALFHRGLKMPRNPAAREGRGSGLYA